MKREVESKVQSEGSPGTDKDTNIVVTNKRASAARLLFLARHGNRSSGRIVHLKCDIIDCGEVFKDSYALVIHRQKAHNIFDPLSQYERGRQGVSTSTRLR
jgi:hypothetical protein